MTTPKFQCWDREYSHMYNNAWPFEHLVYVEMPQDDPEVQQRKSSMHIVNGKWFYFLQRKDVDLRQYTGLKDCRGAEIYEGDIVKWKIFPEDKEPMYIIDAIEYRGGVYAAQRRLEIIGGLPPHRKIEVIGNIYEHPEILEKQEENED